LLARSAVAFIQYYSVALKGPLINGQMTGAEGSRKEIRTDMVQAGKGFTIQA
jgi:hypothetical protein